jgi:hypothetical protein
LNGSTRCQEWYDAGNPSYEQQQERERKLTSAPLDSLVVVAGAETSARYYPARGFATTQIIRRGSEGYYIRCKFCNKEFESKGLRCCSKECERAYLDRQDNLAIMAEAGIEAAPKKRCAAPGCDAIIPKWKNGRQVSARVTFCSPKCRVVAHRAQTAPCNDKALEKTNK